MPYHFTAEPGLLRVVLFGAVTGAELQSLAAELEKIEQALPVTPNRLTDLSQLSGSELSFPDVFAIADRRKAQKIANPVKSAFVAPNAVNIGFARMYQTLNDHPQIEIQIFSSLEDAETWLAES